VFERRTGIFPGGFQRQPSIAVLERFAEDSFAQDG
jgi:hypothetical protein